jgi:hypothetical protein
VAAEKFEIGELDMWTPKQLLTDEVVAALRQSELFPEELIEFLGWNNGRAKRLNSNPNPVKCALTMLRDPTPEDPNERTHYWLQKFFEKKQDSIRPQVETTMSQALAMAGKVKNLASRGVKRDGDHPLFADSYEQALLDNE